MVLYGPGLLKFRVVPAAEDRADQHLVVEGQDVDHRPGGDGGENNRFKFGFRHWTSPS